MIDKDKLTYAGHVLYAQQNLSECEEGSSAKDVRESLLAARQHIDWALEQIAVIETREYEQRLIN